MEQAQNHITEVLNGGFGGHMVIVYNADKQPTELLFMDTADMNTAVNVLRINKNGIGFSNTGVGGSYRTGWLLDGTFVADFITAGNLNANLIRTGTLDGQYFNCINLNAVNATVSGIFKTALDSDNYIQMDGGEMNLYANGQRSVRIMPNIQDDQVVGGAVQLYDANGVRRAALFTDSNSGVTALRFYDEYGNRGTNIASNGIQLYDESGTVIAQFYYGSGGGAYLRMLDPNNSNVYGTFGYNGIWFYDPSHGGAGDIAAMIAAPNGIYTHGDLIVDGSKNRCIKGRLLYAVEASEPFFADVGEGQIGENGKCVIKIDSVFKTVVDLEGYQVFIQKYGQGDCWVERQKTQFTVHGTPGLSFGWELKAHQFDHDGKRLEPFEMKTPEVNL